LIMPQRRLSQDEMCVLYSRRGMADRIRKLQVRLAARFGAWRAAVPLQAGLIQQLEPQPLRPPASLTASRRAAIKASSTSQSAH